MFMSPLTFPQVLERALIAYRIIQTKNRGNVSINSFAKYLGYSRPMVTLWMNGKRKVTYDALENMLPKLHELIGPEVYEMLEHPKPDPVLDYFVESWEALTESQRMDLSAMLEDYLEENKTIINGNSILSKSVT